MPLPELPLHEHPNQSHDIRPDVYRDILSKLKASEKPKPQARPPHVPEALNFALEVIGPVLADFDINITDVTDIQYGKRIKMADKTHAAECNLFYGKLGFSVVGVPRRNSNENLMELCAYLIYRAITQ